MACPRVRNNRAASATVKALAAAKAEYSPSECPATNCASRCKFKPASVSMTRKVASETAINAGCAFSVSVSVSEGPSKMMAAELAAESSINFIENQSRGSKICCERLAHPDGLAALTRKHESDRHDLAHCILRAYAEIGPKDTSMPGSVKLWRTW